jgi:hypothetical protein
VITSTLAIAPSITSVQTPSLAPMLATARTGAAAQGGRHRRLTLYRHGARCTQMGNVVSGLDCARSAPALRSG